MMGHENSIHFNVRMMLALICLSTILSASTCSDSGVTTAPDEKDKQPDDTSAPAEVTDNAYGGVDLLVVIDNSASMTEEHAALSEGIPTLINALTELVGDGDEPSADIRVAVVTSDMGLQWGDGQVGGNTVPVAGCDDRGDDGAFQGLVQDDCAPELDGTWVETSAESPNEDIAKQVACLALQGTDGCGVEQQLEAAVRGLESHPDFLDDSHLLAVLVVSDEEDCSIGDSGLFNTNEWLSGTNADGLLNVACNYPEANNQFLHDAEGYRSRFIDLKDGDADAVVFGAIVGVPAGSDSPCQGDGDEIDAMACLDNEAMQMAVDTFTFSEGIEYKAFVPACTRIQDGVEVTVARPGRRYVELAQAFQQNGFVYSICNKDWSPAMERLSGLIEDSVTAVNPL